MTLIFLPRNWNKHKMKSPRIGKKILREMERRKKIQRLQKVRKNFIFLFLLADSIQRNFLVFAVSSGSEEYGGYNTHRQLVLRSCGWSTAVRLVVVWLLICLLGDLSFFPSKDEGLLLAAEKFLLADFAL